jgi:hypothetical protein
VKRGLARAALATIAVVVAMAASAQAQPQANAEPPRAIVDRAVVRFYASETGGSARPRFITERVLAFEARLEALMEQQGGAPYQERHVRAAIEHHVAQEMLSRLPLERPPTLGELAQQYSDIGQTLMQRAGGREAVLAAAGAEGVSEIEVDELFTREAKAAMYIDRAITPILSPSDEQLREVFRTSAHPFRDKTFDQARPLLLRWFVAERLRAAESAFLQSARTRVKIFTLSR